MATRNYFSKEDEENQQVSNPGSGIISGNPNVGGGQAPAQPTTQGSGFVNLDKYLNANRGQTDGLVDTVVGDLGKDVGAHNANVKGIVGSETNRANSIAADNSELDKYGQTYFDTSGNAIDKAAFNTILQGSDSQGSANNFLNSNQGVLNTRKSEINSGNPFAVGISDSASKAFGSANNSNQSITDKALALQSDAGTQISSLSNAFGGSGQAYTSGFGTLDRFLLNADQNANEREGGTNKLKAGLNETRDSATNASTEQNKLNQKYAQISANKKEMANTKIDQAIAADKGKWIAPEPVKPPETVYEPAPDPSNSPFFGTGGWHGGGNTSAPTGPTPSPGNTGSLIIGNTQGTNNDALTGNAGGNGGYHAPGTLALPGQKKKDAWGR